MKILNYLFRILEPEQSTNWLSIKFSIWKHRKINHHNKRYKDKYKDVTYFKVVGANEICLSNDSNRRCGGGNGYSFSVGWGSSTFWHGGVIHRKEAKRLAYFILNNINNQPID